MHAAGIKVETSKGEAWPGQHEINFRFADALTMADNHVIYKNGAKEIALRERLLDHVHGEAVRVVDRQLVPCPCLALPRRRAGVRRGRRALRPLPRRPDRQRSRSSRSSSRPTINSYKRYRGRKLGADDARVGPRQPHVRVPHRRARRLEARRDADSRAATSTRTSPSRRSSRPACTGSRRSSSLPPALEGNAYESDAERFPSTLRDAIAALESGTVARAAFGDQVVDHYLNYARTEQALFDKVRDGLGARRATSSAG